MSNSIDPSAFWKLSYGLYVVSTCYEGKLNGQISNTVFQVTDTPPQICVSINKQELTHDMILKSGKFSVSILEQDTPMKFIGKFGFKSGREIDKFADTGFEEGCLGGCPVVTDYTVATLEAKLIGSFSVGSHTIFVGEVVSTSCLKDCKPMTYEYYHEVKKGKSPDTAPVTKRMTKPMPRSPIAADEQKALDHEAAPKREAKEYVCYKEKNVCVPADEVDENEDDVRSKTMKSYVCDVCGYVYNPSEGDPDSGIAPGTAFEDIPDDWVCPVCGVGKEEFSEA